MSIANRIPEVNVSRAHSHGIHCCHVYGRDTSRWCERCTNLFLHTDPGFPVNTQSDFDAAYESFRKDCDLNLISTVFDELEEDLLPMPIAYLEVADKLNAALAHAN